MFEINDTYWQLKARKVQSTCFIKEIEDKIIGSSTKANAPQGCENVLHKSWLLPENEKWFAYTWPKGEHKWFLMCCGEVDDQAGKGWSEVQECSNALRNLQDFSLMHLNNQAEYLSNITTFLLQSLNHKIFTNQELSHLPHLLQYPGCKLGGGPC